MARVCRNIIIDVLTLIIVVTIVLLVLHLVRADAECLPSSQAVWDAHPRSHATWNLVDGRECWRVGYGKRREVVHHEQRLRSNTARLPPNDPRPRPAPATAGAVTNSASPGLTATYEPGRSRDSETQVTGLPAAPLPEETLGMMAFSSMVWTDWAQDWEDLFAAREGTDR